jgi:hypothetical protein
MAPSVRRLDVDDGHAFQPLAQKAHAAIDFVQTLLAVGVFGVLGSIALGRSLGYGGGDPRPLVVPQIMQFIAQALCSLRGDVLRGGGRGRPVS